MSMPFPDHLKWLLYVFPIYVVDRYLSVSVLSQTWTDCMLIYSDRFANTPALSTKCCHCGQAFM